MPRNHHFLVFITNHAPNNNGGMIANVLQERESLSILTTW